jgi:hypothetical protein
VLCKQNNKPRFLNFSLQWQEYSSYPDRDYPFGLPSHITLLATENKAAACRVFAEPKGSQHIEWHAKWKEVNIEHVNSCKRVLTEVNAYADLVNLTIPNTMGTYLESWLIVGIDNERKFSASLDFFLPENNLNEQGFKLYLAMTTIKGVFSE